MKKIFLYIGLIFTAIVLFNACSVDDLLLEDELIVEAIIQNETDLSNFLVGAYSFAGSSSTYGGQTYLASELIGNTDELEWRGTFISPSQFINKAMIDDNGSVDNLFEDNYDVINMCNIVLENLEIITSSVENKNRIEGEALFLRGLEYFDLARFFGKQYNAQSNSQLGVSLKLTSTLTEIENLPRNTVEEVYTQVINDLSSAINLLPNSNGFFADKAIAQGLLARVYLQQQNYQAALNLANSVIQSSGHSLTPTFNDAFNNDSNSSEDLFAFQVSVTSGANSMNLFWATSGNGGRPGNPDIAVNDSFINTYATGDDRGAYFYVVGSSGTATTKWMVSNTNVPFMRLAEMYLIRAECNSRLNSSTGDSPLNDINLIRSRSNAPLLSSINLADIINERKFELAFEGHLLHDIKRLGLTAGGLNFNDDKLVMPIPIAEMNANPNSTQNPGY
jgi:tetratricopeptide (TPR) repeat protein